MAGVRSARAQSRKTEILEVATDLFLANGFEAVSVDAVIARAGGTKTNVYTYFDGKAGLFSAVVKDMCEKAVPSFEDLRLELAAPDEALRQIGRRFLSSLLAKPSIRQHRLIITEAMRFPALGKRWFEAGPEAARAVLARYFLELRKSGLTSAIAPRRLAGLFLDMLSHEQLLHQLVAGGPPPAPREIAKRVDEAVNVFLNGARLRR